MLHNMHLSINPWTFNKVLQFISFEVLHVFRIKCCTTFYFHLLFGTIFLWILWKISLTLTKNELLRFNNANKLV